MDREEFAERTQRLKERLYRTAYLYLGNEADALEAVDEAVYLASAGACASCGRRTFLKHG